MVGAMENKLLARFPGVIAFPATPFDAEGEVDLNAFERNLSPLLKRDFAALAVIGSNGEMPSLTLDEYERVATKAAELIGGSKGLILGCGQTLRTAEAQARIARKVGAEAILLVSPYSNDLSEPGLADYYARVAGAAEIPIFLYQTKWSGVLPLTLLERLTGVENLAMVKDENGSIGHYLNVRQEFGDRFHWVNGMAEPYVPSYWNMGVETFTSGLACFIPDVTLQIRDLARAGDFPAVNRLLDEVITPLYRLRNRRPGYKTSMIKAAMTLCGLEGGRVRAPLVEMTAEDHADLNAFLTDRKLKDVDLS